MSMYLEEVISSGQTNIINRATQSRYKQEEESSSTPFSWGSDTITISDEARAAMQQASAGSDQDTENSASDEKSEAAQKFSDYMDKKTGKKSDSGSPEEQIEALKAKLKTLQSQLSQVASNTGSSDAAKESQMQNLNAQISTVQAQIDELTKMMTESADA